jgi:hypothetical protein
MARKKEREQEIVAVSPMRRPYGVKLALLLEPGTKFSIEGDCTLLTSQGYIIRMVPNQSEPNKLRLPSHQCWDIVVEGFATAGEAEQIGLKVALGFIWLGCHKGICCEAPLLYSSAMCSI